MNIEILLQDVNVAVDWHIENDHMDCYRESDGEHTPALTIRHDSLYYAQVLPYVQQRFELDRLSGQAMKVYRRELPDKSFMLDQFETGDDLRFFLHADGSNDELIYHGECDRPAEAVAAAREWVAKYEAKRETVEIEEERNAILRLNLDEAAARYGVLEPA